MSLQQHFKTKYDLFIESTNYDQSFSWIDGFLFYDMFIELSIFEPTREQKEAKLAVVLETVKEWHKGDAKPSKLRGAQQLKHLIFKDFVFEMAEDVEFSTYVFDKLF